MLEALEQLADLFGRHANAGVRDGGMQQHLAVAALPYHHRDADLATIGELHRVVGVIDQDLAQAQRITDQRFGHVGGHIEHQLQALGRGFLANQVGHVVQQRVQPELHTFDIQLAGLDLGEVQDVVDQPEQVLCRGLDLADVVVLARRQVGLECQVAHADDGVHGRADLVAHVGQEITLGLRSALG